MSRAESVSLDQLLKFVIRTLETYGLTEEEFEQLGEADELLERSPALDFAYKAVWPLVKELLTPA